MGDTQELTVAEPQPPQQLITIEPAKYVELVFEPFAKRLADAKVLAEAAEFDVTTTAGMAVAVKHRATFREIRVASERARKERKAPILEIGKLLDSRQKEIEAEIEPFESRFDSAIKAEEARKEAEKQAKAAAENARVDAIRAKIDAIRATPAKWIGKPSADIGVAADHLSETVIDLEGWAEFEGEAMVERDHAVRRMREMQAKQAEHEAEQARLVAERAELERLRDEAVERDRLAALARREEERKVAAARAAEEARLRAEREAHEAELRRQREAEEARLRAQREAEERMLAVHRQEIERQRAEIAAAKAEQERIERERLAAIEAEERRKREEAEAAARAEAERLERERQAEAERAALAAEVARLHALHFAGDGLGMLEDVLEEIARPIGQECCGRGDSECCGCPDPVYHDVGSLSTELNKWRNEIIARRAEQKEAA